jgi:hypothetical protein
VAREKYESDSRPGLRERYATVRRLTEALAAPLSPEDQCVQPMLDASPTKWPLAHTAWFFDALILTRFQEGYQPFDRRFFVV